MSEIGGNPSRCDMCSYFAPCKNTCDTCETPCKEKCPADCGVFDKDPDDEEAPIPQNPGDREYDADWRDPDEEPEDDNDTEL